MCGYLAYCDIYIYDIMSFKLLCHLQVEGMDATTKYMYPLNFRCLDNYRVNYHGLAWNKITINIIFKFMEYM